MHLELHPSPVTNSTHSRCIGGILTFDSYKNDFRYSDKTTVNAVMVSLQNVGAFLAALCIFPISERFGRKKTIQVAMSIFCVGVILQVVPSHSLVCFYIGRFVSGLGLGGGTAVVPTYNAEMAPKEIRGMLGSGVQWLFALGVMISYWIDYAVQQTLPVSSKQWQIPVGCSWCRRLSWLWVCSRSRRVCAGWPRRNALKKPGRV